MNLLSNLIKELRERKLWPIAIGLIVALVAVPVLLSKKAPTALVTQPTGGLPYSTGTVLPAISIKTTPAASKLAGRGHNPFTPQDVATTATTTTTTATSTTASPSTTSASTGSTGSSTGSSSSGGSTTAPSTSSSTPPATTTTPTLTSPKPAPPAPAGLTAKQSYQVSLAMTDSGGGVNTIDPL
ncbi:MAG: hypothetical protein ACRDPA_04450 [Solirubrobacteraceae bacterium]